MKILFLLIPLSLALFGLAIWAFLWAVRSGQFDDLDSPGWRVLQDEDPELDFDLKSEEGSDD